jgi:hypothetical protein
VEGENPCGVMAALVRCQRNVYYQVEQRASIGGKCDTPEIYTSTQSLET